MLADRVEELRARAGPDRGARLSMYLDALAASPNARSTLRWMATEPFGLLEDVVDGALELSHQGFDQRQGDQGEGSAVAYLREALVAHGALPERDETIAGFDRWLDRTLAGLPDGPDRAAVTAFATWQVARRLAETTARHQGAPPESAVKHARTQVREAIRLTQWLHAQTLDLGDLRQDLLDEWLAAGASTRRSVSGFIDWLSRAHPVDDHDACSWRSARVVGHAPGCSSATMRALDPGGRDCRPETMSSRLVATSAGAHLYRHDAEQSARPDSDDRGQGPAATLVRLSWSRATSVPVRSEPCNARDPRLRRSAPASRAGSE
jgi:hypothetical protein